tara:strand:+ start:10878 stop:11438 length:561 start_codon:yes stop_codon:yes gene_type:complete
MSIIETQTGIKDLIVIKPTVFTDSRGYFFESYNKQKYLELGIKADFVQDNQSYSKYGSIRGLHFQKGEYAQAKLVRVVQGSVLDVAIDLRVDSETFGKSFSIKLSGENKLQVFIPKGFAHGFSVLSKNAIFEYKCDNFYNKNSESGILFNDLELNIDWQILLDNQVVSDKDKELPSFNDYRNNPCF